MPYIHKENLERTALRYNVGDDVVYKLSLIHI